MERADAVVIGGGIVGLATAYAIAERRPGGSVLVLEKEASPASHQSGRNSGVIHSGVYYRPGSLKAQTVRAGREALLRFSQENGVRYEITGKVIVAVDETERPQLDELRRRGEQNGIRVQLISRQRLLELEPHAEGVAALHVPDAGVIDFARVCAALARRLADRNGEVRTGWRVRSLAEEGGSVVARCDSGDVMARVAVNCAGLHCDRVAARSGAGAGDQLRIVPFRGEYRDLAPARAHLVRSMIYPVPDSRFPFLGAHFTRTVEGRVHAGPNAVLALAREGYSWRIVDPADTLDLFRFPGFRRLVARYWRTGLGEVHRSVSPRAFLRALQRLVPAVQVDDLLPAAAGVRAQAVGVDGSLVDDFVIRESSRVVHVLNAPSPAATASLEIGRLVAERALQRL